MNLDEIFEKAKTQAEFLYETATKKGADVLDTSKIKLKIFDLKSDVNTHYKELGKLVFKSQTGTNVTEDELQKIIAILLAKKDEITALNAELLQKKKPKICKGCETICGADDKSCSNCGGKL